MYLNEQIDLSTRPGHRSRPTLPPEETCWRPEQTGRFAIAIDTAAYFQTLHAACEQAHRSFFIIGWGFDRIWDQPRELIESLRTPGAPALWQASDQRPLLACLCMTYE